MCIVFWKTYWIFPAIGTDFSEWRHSELFWPGAKQSKESWIVIQHCRINTGSFQDVFFFPIESFRLFFHHLHHLRRRNIKSCRPFQRPYCGIARHWNVSCEVRMLPECLWSNSSDLTCVLGPQKAAKEGNSPSGKHRLVRYYNLARWLNVMKWRASGSFCCFGHPWKLYMTKTCTCTCTCNAEYEMWDFWMITRTGVDGWKLLEGACTFGGWLSEAENLREILHLSESLFPISQILCQGRKAALHFLASKRKWVTKTENQGETVLISNKQSQTWEDSRRSWNNRSKPCERAPRPLVCQVSGLCTGWWCCLSLKNSTNLFKKRGHFNKWYPPRKFSCLVLKSYRNPIGKDLSSNHHFFRDEQLNFGGVHGLTTLSIFSWGLGLFVLILRCLPRLRNLRGGALGKAALFFLSDPATSVNPV